MSGRIRTIGVAGVAVLTCIALSRAATQGVDQNDNPNRAPAKRANKTTSKPRGPQPIYLTPKVAEILRLTKSGISDDVVVAYVEKSPTDYQVTPRQLVSLRDAGLSERVLKVLAEHRSPTPDELGLSQGRPSASAQSLYEGLNSYGHWFYVPGYGWCWQPGSAPAEPSNEPFGADGFPVPPMYSTVIAGNGGFGFPFDGHGEHPPPHGTNNQHQAQRQHHPPAQGAGHMARGQSGPPLARVSNVPSGVLGASPASSSPLAARPSELTPNIPHFALGAGTLGFGQLGRGEFGALPSSSSLGMSPFLPVGGQVPSGSASPFGVAGMPLTRNNGANPFLPVGGTPALGSLPPYSIAGVPFTPSSGANPWLPVGGTAANGSLPPFGVVMPPGGFPMSPPQQPGFEFLQPSFHFLQPTFSFLPNTGTLAPGPVTRSAPMMPMMPTYALGGVRGGWSGFHGSAGGFHGGGGGGGGGHR
jgi:hypothetical protein